MARISISPFIACLCFLAIPPNCKAFTVYQDTHIHQRRLSRAGLYATADSTSSKDALSGLTVAIVGGGPSGLLLAHKLLAGGAKVSVFESRSRPREVSKEPRAYALGVGMRGRTAIQSVDMTLWNAVKNVGFASERFELRVGPLRLRLRDGSDAKSAEQEPSLLLYQTDLCRVMAEELEKRWSSPNFKLKYDTRVTQLDLTSRMLTTSDNFKQAFDVVVGCDGVNSIVRKTIDECWPAFETIKNELPGNFKVFQLPKMPPKLDPSAVSFLLPKSGSCTAFVEPTVDKGCCVLLAGRGTDDGLLSLTNVEELKSEIIKRFPLLEGVAIDKAAAQLASSNSSSAASVVCNIYHYSNLAVLVGDAAHATGGVSGQGVNSALLDSKVLAECLVAQFQSTRKDRSLSDALLQYSQRQVPEGKALYDLSFGPKETTALQRIGLRLVTLRDSIFKGRLGIGNLPLQTLLTTSLVPFAEIRQQRDRFYNEAFPSPDEWSQILAKLDSLD
ncbi:hypothetical protein ACA910_017082 [Epithemia clementina (nom. ined.)]